MFCKGCGKSVDTSAATCPHCGRNVDCLSGGTGFWDLLEQTPERHTPHKSPEEEAHHQAWEEQLGHGVIEPVERPAKRDEIPQMPHDSSIARRQSSPTRRQTALPRRISPFIIGISAAVCALIVAAALILSHCSHVGEEGGIAEDGQSEASIASEWNGANGEGNEEGEQDPSQGDAEDNAGRASEDNRGTREQDNPLLDYQDKSGNDDREIGRSESAQSTQEQSNEQQQEEGTRNGQ